MVYVYNGILLTHKKDEIFFKRWNIAICKRMDLKDITLSEIIQMKKDKKHDFIHKWEYKKK